MGDGRLMQIRGLATPLPAPKNDGHCVALLAGGPEDLMRDIRTKFSDWGIEIRHHSYRPRDTQKPIPADVDVVFILRDHYGHSEIRIVSDRAAKAGVPAYVIERKAAGYNAILVMLGFKPGTGLPELAPAPAADDRWYDNPIEAGLAATAALLGPAQPEETAMPDPTAAKAEAPDTDLEELEAQLCALIPRLRSRLRLRKQTLTLLITPDSCSMEYGDAAKPTGT